MSLPPPLPGWLSLLAVEFLNLFQTFKRSIASAKKVEDRSML
jgi:hypothetical protein